MNTLPKLALASAALAAVAIPGDRRVQSAPDATAVPSAHACCGSTTLIDELPFEINSSGTYCVTQNLAGLDGLRGIVVDASSVVIDLHGHSLFANGGTIAIDASNSSSFHVRNGQLLGWYTGIAGGLYGRVSDVHCAEMMDDVAIDLSRGAIVENCTFRRVRIAVYVATNSMVRNCFAQLVETGFRLGSNSRAESCSVLTAELGVSSGNYSTLEGLNIVNAERGVELERGARMSNSVVDSFDLSGILLETGAWVGHSTVANGSGVGIVVSESRGAVEGCQVVDVEGVGLQLMAEDSVALRNVCSGNSGVGLQVTGNRNRIQDNSVDSNGSGLVVAGFDNLVIGNRAAGNAGADFDVAFPNTVGPTLSSPFWIQGSVPQANFATPIP